MKKELLCNWLGLSAWPPDHYALLGLTPDADVSHIERQVHDRMCKLRCYQLSHPEEATEGMNRVAQAFITVSEAASKRAAPKVTETSRNLEDTAVIQQTKVDWKAVAPPVRVGDSTLRKPAGAAKSSESTSNKLATVDTPTPMPAKRVHPFIPVAQPYAAPQRLLSPASIRELAVKCDEASTGLGTLVALIDRIERTRRLLVAWDGLEAYLRRPAGRPVVLAEKADFSRKVGRVARRIEGYPGFVGLPGKPGYRVVALARLEMTLDMLLHMSAEQRDDTLRDWENVRCVLLAHRSFLRQQFKSMRRKGRIGLFVRAVRALVNDHPVLVGTCALALLAGGFLARGWLFAG